MINGMDRDVLYRRRKILTRDGMLVLLRAALESGETRFLRQTALAWLAAFPGDLEVTVFHAQGLIAEGWPAQAISALEQVHQKDPFSRAASQALVRAYQTSHAHYSYISTVNYVLGGAGPSRASLEAWGEPLLSAWRTLAKDQYVEAEQMIQVALQLAPGNLMVAALHLQLIRRTREAQAVMEMAQAYHDRWPDCLPVALVLAEIQLALGNEPEAVRLLHLCAANDTSGQTARRLWGEAHPYRSLWPGEGGIHPMVIHFDQPIPAGVAARLGWNQLAPGEYSQPAAVDEQPVERDEPAEPLPDTKGVAVLETMPADLDPVGENIAAEPPEIPLPAIEPPVGEAGSREPARPENEIPAPLPVQEPPPARSCPTPRATEDSLAHRVEKEFKRLAKSMKQPDLARADGRYPVYVILSSREGLDRQYGLETAAVVDSELNRLAEQMRKKRGWDALVFYADDAACMARFGLTPVNPRDAWKLKHTLADLDGALARRGEMIGALLIAGGEEVIPFHRLPNPTEDPDGDVPSDSPYATRDANYFVPEWPLGRLPGEASPDAGLLLEQIREICRYHRRRDAGRRSIGKVWLHWLHNIFDNLVPNRTKPSFGYTAAVWRRSSLAVFRPIGAPHTVMASPPAASGSFNPQRLTGASLGYYNLHGLEESPAWYGQRDPLEQGIYPDYPVALSPADLHKNGHAPRFVFSEACFGGSIQNKSERDSLALKFLTMGTSGVVASTCTAYGSVSTPLIAADLLGYLFWLHLKSGQPVGAALLRAKIDLVCEMNRRQGYLDGEDQKTLISFVLYGDPLAAYEDISAQKKHIYRFKDHPMVRTVSEVETEGAEIAKMPTETLDQVKKVVAEYLPGADLAGMRFCRLQANSGGQDVGLDHPRQKAGREEAGRVVVTVSKQVQFAQHLHRHYLRVTIDKTTGKPVKMALSR